MERWESIVVKVNPEDENKNWTNAAIRLES